MYHLFLPILQTFILLYCFIYLSIVGMAQTRYLLDDFSDRYHATVDIHPEDQDAVFKRADIRVYDSHSQQELIHLEVEELVFEEGEVIQAMDVNFDGVDDLVIQDGQNSCYHQASYQIYLQIGNQLIQHEALTRLAQVNCGLFEIDPQSKTITTRAKSGCCWHETVRYTLVDDQPQPIESIVYDGTHRPYQLMRIRTWKGNEVKERTEKRLSATPPDIQPICSFEMKKSKKKVLVFGYGQELHYAFLTQDELVEFSYPIEDAPNKTNFLFKQHPEEYRLSFQNGSAQYVIYQIRQASAPNKIGIEVSYQNKLHDLQGDPRTITGSLTKLKDHTWKNLKYKSVD